MDEPLEKSFVQQMQDALQKQLSEFSVAKKKEQHNTRIVADEGTKRWRDLKDSLKHHVEEINDELVESLLSYGENASGNEFTLRHELNDRTVQITFEPASALISYQGKIGKGAFHARVEGDALEYGWENITRCDGVQPLRHFRLEEGETPASFSTKEMSEIIIRCVVLAPVSEGLGGGAATATNLDAGGIVPTGYDRITTTIEREWLGKTAAETEAVILQRCKCKIGAAFLAYCLRFRGRDTLDMDLYLRHPRPDRPS